MCLSLNAEHHAILASEVHLANLPGGKSQPNPNRDRLHLISSPERVNKTDGFIVHLHLIRRGYPDGHWIW